MSFGFLRSLLECGGMDLPPETVGTNGLKEKTFSEQTYRWEDEKGTILPIGEMSQIPEQPADHKNKLRSKLRKGWGLRVRTFEISWASSKNYNSLKFKVNSAFRFIFCS